MNEGATQQDGAGPENHDGMHHHTRVAYDHDSSRQDNRSWKDPSRPPSDWRQEREGNSHPSPVDDPDCQYLSDEYSSRRRQHRNGERKQTLSRNRGDLSSYGRRDRNREYGTSSRCHRYERRDRDTLHYDDDYESEEYRGDHRDDNYDRQGRRDRLSPSRDRHASRDYWSTDRGKDWDTDRHNDHYRGGRRIDAHQRNSGRRSESPGHPTDTVIVDGITPNIEENDLYFGFHALQLNDLQDIRVRRERNSARRIAFLEFGSVASAKAFVDSSTDLNVTLQLPHNAHPGFHRVRISYSWAKRDDSWRDWKCENCLNNNYSSRRDCYGCGEPRTRPDSSSGDDGPILTGEKDACPNQKPYPIVVITGLDGSTSEDVFAKGVMKLYLDDGDETAQPTAPSGLKTTAPIGSTKGLGARRGSLRRVFLVRDRKSRSSWKYGFAEFATTEDAVKAVAKYHASQRYTIASKPVTVAFIHTGVFVPVFPPEPQTAPFAFNSLHNPDIRLRYWEYRAYVNPLVVSTKPIAEAAVSGKPNGAEKKSKKRKADKEAGAAKKKTPAMAPQMQMWASKSAEIRGKSSNETPLGQDPSVVGVGPGPAKIQAVELSVPGPSSTTATAASTTATVELSQSDQIWSFADPRRVCCLLCHRKFKSMEMVRKHEVESSMHKENTKEEGKKSAATKALAALGLDPVIVEIGPQYRDRAKERRTTHNQPKKPLPEPRSDQSEHKKAPEPAAAIPSAPKISKGMAMLNKMGLKVGEGLGVDGSGRTDIINTDLYKPGVGIGADGAKVGDAGEEGAKATRNEYGDFLTKTKDKARERFEKLNTN